MLRYLIYDTVDNASLAGGLADGGLDGGGEVLDVLLVDAGHGDPTALEEVDVVLVDQDFALFDREPGEGEHADLVGDVVPCACD